MPIYTGKSADGSDAKEAGVEVFLSEDKSIWSTKPLTKDQAKSFSMKNEVLDYMNDKRSLDMVREEILNKTCSLSKRCRDYILSHYDEQGNFIKEN